MRTAPPRAAALSPAGSARGAVMASGGALGPAPDPPGVAVGCSWPCVPPDGLARALCLRRGAGRDEAR